MMKMEQMLTLDLQNARPMPLIRAKQGDQATRFVRIGMTCGGEPYQPPEGTTAHFRCLKRDGNSCLNPAQINPDSTVTVELTEQTLALPGNVWADVCLMDGSGAVLSTMSFQIEVEFAPVGVGAASQNEALAFPEGYTAAIDTLTAGVGADRIELHAIGQLAVLESDVAGDIYKYAFHSSNLERVVLNQVNIIQTYAFTNSSKLQSVHLPLVTKIEACAFQGCSALSEVYIPSIYNLAGFSFRYCSSLKMVDANQLISVEPGAFNGCTSLETLILRRRAVVTIHQASTFANTMITAGTGYIYVPSDWLEAYKAASVWSELAAQFRAIEDYPEICGGAAE